MQIALALVLVSLAARADAAVTVHGKTTASLFKPRAGAWAGQSCTATGGPFNYEYLLASTGAPSSGTSDSFAPANGSSTPCQYQRSTGTYLAFVTPPLSGPFTIAGNISAVCSTVESSTSLNALCTLNLYRWNAARGGIEGLFWSGTTTAETASCANRAIGASGPNCTPSSKCALATGDRIIIVPTVAPNGSFGANGSRTCGLCFNGAAAGANELSVTFFETLTFSADAAGPTGALERVSGD